MKLFPKVTVFVMLLGFPTVELFAQRVEAVSGFDLEQRKPVRAITITQRANTLRNLSSVESELESRGLLIQAEAICDEDTREEIDDCSVAPWSGNCFLVVKMGDNVIKRGTGWLLSPKLVVTAAHNLHWGSGAEYFDEVEVIPGFNVLSSDPFPFGTETSRELRVSDEWRTNGEKHADYGAIILSDGFEGDGMTPFQLAVLSDEDISGSIANIGGYPGDKTRGTQWFSAGEIGGNSTATRLRYLIDTFSGMSGSAVWRLEGGRREVFGIHNYSGCPNHATRITDAVLQDILEWKAESEL